MAELRPIPFAELLAARARRAGAAGDRCSTCRCARCGGRAPELDLSVDVHGHRAQSPVGPAAGPHAQLAQNIVLAWAAGSRVIELKTVQVLDELKIPRPCIDAATIGYNVEWSQELRLAESLREYVAGWMLVRILRELDPLGLGAAAAQSEPVFELSVGYDLEGLQSVQMHNYLMQAQNVAPLIDELRALIPREHARLRELDYRTDLVTCVTLSTFHGCPPDEIEAIARYLLDEIGVDVIVKLNPTLLGYDEVVVPVARAHGLSRPRARSASAFDGDLKWQEAIALGWRLNEAAARHGRSFGVKMTNTLVVENHKKWLPGEEMYLSGPPLHVLAMHCVERWRAAFGGAVPLSFSGGIDQHNVVDAVACDFVPVTTCTDLLRPGGYGRLRQVSREPRRGDDGVRRARSRRAHRASASARRTRRRGSSTARSRSRACAVDAAERRARIVRMAGVLNSHEVAARVTGDPRYAAGKNGKPPRKVGSTLVLLDCLSCDKCVPVCPNDANFAIDTPPEEVAYEDVVVDAAAR